MRMKTVLKNKKGNALLFAVVTFSVLLIVAIGISVLSAASVKLSTQDRKYNSTYYLAEAGTQKGLQQVKDAVAKYYQSMYDYWNNTATWNDAAYNTYLSNYYSNFYDNILTNVQGAFKEPTFNEDAFKTGVSTTTTITDDVTDTSDDTGNFTVTSKVTNSDGSSRTVQGTINVTRQHVVEKKSGTYDPSVNMLTVGGKMVFNSSTSAINEFMLKDGGKALVGGYTNQNDPTKKFIDPPGNVTVDPGFAANMAFSLSYDTMLQKLNSSLQPAIEIKSASGPTQTDIATQPCYLYSKNGLSFNVNQIGLNKTGPNQIYCDGDLIYNSGDFVGNIFCKGNVTINNVHFTGNIVAAKNVTLNTGSFLGEIANGKLNYGLVYAGYDVNFIGGGVIDGIIYAHRDFNMNCNASVDAVVYAERNININATNTFGSYGSMTAKGDMNWNQPGNYYHSIGADTDLLNAAKKHDWYSTLFSTTTYNFKNLNLDTTVVSNPTVEK